MAIIIFEKCTLYGGLLGEYYFWGFSQRFMLHQDGKIITMDVKRFYINFLILMV